MNDSDLTVLAFLAHNAGFSDSQICHVRDWWRACREGEEELAAFLQRQQLVNESTAQVFRQVGSQALSFTAGRTLVDRAELETMRRRLPEVAVIEDAQVPATVTLLGEVETALQLEAAKTDPPRVGGRLGKYLLTECIGQGAAGVVYRALHPTLHIPVAVKVLHLETGDAGAERRGRLKAEAQVLAQLNHPNIVRVFDYDQVGPHAFLVLECVNGPNLAELIDQCGRMQPDRVVRMARQLADALAAAHRLGIVHRDIKPANILLTRDGTAKLADLGLATLRAPLGPAGSPVPASARVGTVRYLAPELAAGNRPANERSDIYAFGATLFHALTGVPLFSGASPWEVLSHHAKTPPPSPRRLVPEIPLALADLVVRMVAKKPEDRPASFVAILADAAMGEVRPEGDQLARRSAWSRMLAACGLGR